MSNELKKSEKKEKRKADKRHICIHCSKAFSFPNKLRNHIRSSHSLAHVCEYCDVKFDRFNQLRTHIAFAHHIRYKCTVCAYSSSVKAELKKHIVVNHENGVWCTIDGCNTTVAYRMLKKHIREAHSKKEDSIEHDVVPLKKLKKLIAEPHDAVGNVVGNHTNNADLNDLTDNSDVLAGFTHQSPTRNLPSENTEVFHHQQVESGVSLVSAADEPSDCPKSPSFSCSENGCNKKFRRLRELKRHKVRFHNVLTNDEEEEYIYICEHSDCGRRFRNSAGLRQHNASHGDGLVVTCDSCKRKFKNRASFAIHLRKYHLMSVRDVNYTPLFVSVSEESMDSVKNAA